LKANLEDTRYMCGLVKLNSLSHQRVIRPSPSFSFIEPSHESLIIQTIRDYFTIFYWPRYSQISDTTLSLFLISTIKALSFQPCIFSYLLWILSACRWETRYMI